MEEYPKELMGELQEEFHVEVRWRIPETMFEETNCGVPKRTLGLLYKKISLIHFWRRNFHKFLHAMRRERALVRCDNPYKKFRSLIQEVCLQGGGRYGYSKNQFQKVLYENSLEKFWRKFKHPWIFFLKLYLRLFFKKSIEKFPK